MREPPDALPDAGRLPDFCSLPVLFALLSLAGLTVTVMLLAPGSTLDLSGFAAAALFAVWLALLIAVALCKLRASLLRLPGLATFAGVWGLIVAIVLLASALVGWLDHAADLGLTPMSSARFVLGNGAIAALIGAVLLRYFYVLAQWQARLAAVSRAQVQALQARIRPHFLFNSMNTVAALVRVDPAAAERSIEDLSELFRAALGGDGEGTLGEELALVERYLAIEQWRLGARLQVERELGDLPLDLPLPRLLLQPLVENAVRHGIQPLREGGMVSLRARRLADAIEIEIGNPFPEVRAEGGHGHGLDSVRQRLGYHFGARGTLHTAIGKGRFVVTVRLPA
jgi:two-component system sensor histidine kinase AlgZ